MSQTQRIIKYCAIGFAWFLVVSIVSGIMVGIVSLINIFDEEEVVLETMKSIAVDGVIDSLDIEVTASKILFKEGSSFSVETNSKYIRTKQSGTQLSIEEKEHMLLNKSDNSSLIIYVPDDFEFKKVSIEAGAGRMEIVSLTTKKLDLDLGAGKVDIGELIVLTKMDVDGGAGSIIIKDGSINNLELDMGVGELDLTARITGNNQLDAGVGNVNLNLIGSKEDYRFKIDNGVGNATINGESVTGGNYYGNGINLLDIDGGVGNINISFSN